MMEKKIPHFMKEPIDDETETKSKQTTKKNIKHANECLREKKKKNLFANRKSMLSSRNT